MSKLTAEELAEKYRNFYDGLLSWECPECGFITADSLLHNDPECHGCNLSFSQDSFEPLLEELTAQNLLDINKIIQAYLAVLDKPTPTGELGEALELAQIIFSNIKTIKKNYEHACLRCEHIGICAEGYQVHTFYGKNCSGFSERKGETNTDSEILAYNLITLHAENEKLIEQTRWRSVEEEPDDGAVVHTTWDGVHISEYPIKAIFHDGQFVEDFGLNNITDKVTHWRPLPALPEQADE